MVYLHSSIVVAGNGFLFVIWVWGAMMGGKSNRMRDQRGFGGLFIARKGRLYLTCKLSLCRSLALAQTIQGPKCLLEIHNPAAIEPIPYQRNKRMRKTSRKDR